MRIRIATVAVGALIAVSGIAACTAHGGAGSSAGDRSAGGRAAAVPAGPATDKSAAGSGAGGRSGTVLTDELALSSAQIRTAQMTVAITHGQSVTAKADAAEAITVGTGGEVDADDRTSGSYPSATLVLRVPPDALSAALQELARLGTERSRHVSTQDVTSKVADVNSRVTSARESIARLRALYQHAVKIADVIAVEGELSDRESDLESLEAQQRALAAQTSMATITLSLTSTAAPVTKPPAQHRAGFLGGLRNGWDAFAGGAAWVATAVGAVLPFALLLAVLAVIVRLLWPRLRPARQPEA
jgi:hypothetical protein